MPISIGLDELQRRIQVTQAQWEAGETSQSQHTPAQAQHRHGYVPGPNDPSLEAAESIAHERAANALAAAPAPGAAAPPPAYDWRSAAGGNYVTAIEDQGGCGSCVAFGTIAALESLVRIVDNDPTRAIDLSEAHLFFCYGPNAGAGRCPGGGWWPDAAYDSLKTGVVDAVCFPYTPADQPCNLCAQWQSDLTQITGWHKLTTIGDMKAFLSTVGPLTACFTVYEDFYYHYTGGVYRYVSGNPVGGHCVCIIGYDDNQGCWIAKNSWGTGWGEQGFFRIGYGQCGIDSEMWAPEGILHTADQSLQVVGLTGDGQLWHTIRNPDGTWAPEFGNVEGQEANNPGAFVEISCAGA